MAEDLQCGPETGWIDDKKFLLVNASMIVMIGRVKDDDASSADFLPLKRKMNPGLGGSVAERPARPKQQDELAGKFGNGKAFILTDLRYRYSSQNSRGSATNIRGGLADRVRGICDQHHGLPRR